MRGRAEIEELYRRHGAALVLFAAAIAGDRGRFQDAVHQVFLKLLSSDTANQAADPKAYLFPCVRNAVFNPEAAAAPGRVASGYGLVRTAGT